MKNSQHLLDFTYYKLRTIGKIIQRLVKLLIKLIIYTCCQPRQTLAVIILLASISAVFAALFWHRVR